MPHKATFDTRLSLLERLHPMGVDDDAWAEFTEHYTAILERWCRTWGVGSSDMDDLIQNTLISVMSSVSKFEHRGPGSFRSWMKTIARRCFIRLLKHSDRDPVNQAQAIDDRLELASADLIEEFDKQAEQELLSVGMALTRQRVNENTWQAFELTVLHGMPVAEASVQLKMPAGNVYVARLRVQRMITECLLELDHNN